MRTVEGAGRKEPVGFLKDVGRSVHHQDGGQAWNVAELYVALFSFFSLMVG